MSGKIFLSGGGDLEQTRELDSRFFGELPRGGRILYVPIALKRDRIGYEACWDWFAGAVAAHAGDADFSMDLTGQVELRTDRFDALYLGGGNTYKLLDFLSSTPLGAAIPAFLRAGGTVYGGSAGAIVLGQDIRTVEEENDAGYVLHSGLSLLRGYSVICHYTPERAPHVAERAALVGPVIALDESSGIIVADDVAEAVGRATVFSSSTETREFGAGSNVFAASE